jgi:hypothetical protein
VRVLFWLTEGEPADWPLLVWPPEQRFLRFDMPLTEFVYKLFSGKHDSVGGVFSAEWFKARRKDLTFTPG